MAGSSPHGRGTPTKTSNLITIFRFIPARAGNTCPSQSTWLFRSVHPRTGGEHSGLMSMRRLSHGSSPHGRGTLDGRAPRCFVRRFIPARAGNTSAHVRREWPMPVHPRTGGEHSPRVMLWSSSCGSSPHGRGTQFPSRRPCQTGRFIPARAGNTSVPAPQHPPPPVHPRTGGEHSATMRSTSPSSGSSPHGRGTHRWISKVLPDNRFIPARAGNTFVFFILHRAAPVHPRTGGEHYSHRSVARAIAGSSPHGRGTRSQPRHNYRVRRFIPARAGNTSSMPRRGTPTTVHPRTGGEHSSANPPMRSLSGSSPHGRGTRDIALEYILPRRFIPARAGNTSPPMTAGLQSPVHPRTGGEHL